MLGILAAKTCGVVTDQTIAASAIAEIIHSATLLHDDVADNSDKRRGKETVHKLFSPAASVLTGDFWLAKALSLVTKQGDHVVLSQYVNAVEELSEGELKQMDKAIKMDTTEEDYYKIIKGKTASLFIAVIKSASYTAGASKEELLSLETYAYHLGIAFQIRDDIFDYNPLMDTGKVAGTDIREKKITLPLIKAFESADKIETKKILDSLKEVEYADDTLVKRVMDFVTEYKGIESAQATLEDHCKMAANSLSGFKESIYKNHLIDLAGYVGSRKS
jgi:octaprenyl-diphosphate synthase